MNKNNEELLTYEILNLTESIHIAIPVQNLIDPKFKLIDNKFYINLDNENRSYLIRNLPSDLIESIKKNKVFLKENLSLEFGKIHEIKI